ncbi:MAG TPA: type VII secretion target [Micromonosporaceae bacterium]
MPKTGRDLGADLYELWRAGQHNLPLVAAEYQVAHRCVGNAESVGSAFRRPEQFGGTHGPAYPRWEALRGELETILRDTATNLEDVADALRLAASEYARVDSEAARELDRLKRVNGGGL